MIPLRPMPANTNLIFGVNGVDMQGATFSVTRTFKTGASDDATPPQVVSVSPAAGASVPNRQWSIQFSEPVDFSTITAESVGIYSNGSAIQVSPVLTPDGMSLSFTMNAALGSDRIQLFLTPGVKDLGGNSLPFFSADYVLPTVGAAGPGSQLKTWPLAGATDVAPDVIVSFFSSTGFDAALVRRAVRLFTDDSPVAGEWRFDSSSSVAQFFAAAPYPPGSVVRVFISEAIAAYMGQQLYSFQIRGARQSGPVLLRVNTRDSSTAIAANTVLEAEFASDVAADPTLVRLQRNLDGFRYEDVPIDVVRVRPRVLRLVPRQPLLTNAGYAIRFSGQVAATSAGNQINYGPVFFFRTTTPLAPASPLIVGHSPYAGASGVGRNGVISVMLSREWNPLSAAVENVQLTAKGRPIPIHTSLPLSRSLLEIIPDELLPSDATVQVNMRGLQSSIGEPVQDLSFEFSTSGIVDMRGPQVSPGALDVLGGSPPTEPIRLVSNKPLSVKTLVSRVSPGPALTLSLSTDQRVLTLTPSPSWPRGTKQSLLLELRDWTENYGSASLAFEVDFEADSTPFRLERTSFEDGQTGVPLNSRFAIALNHPAGDLSGIRLLQAGAAVPLIPADPNAPLPYLQPELLLAPNTDYELRIENLLDRSGNRLENPSVVHFRTGETADFAKLDATMRFPSNVPLNASLRIQFSRPIDLAYFAKATPALLTKMVRSGGSGFVRNVPATPQWADGNRTLTVVPGEPLEAQVDYTINLSGVRDYSGHTTSSINFRSTGVVDNDAPQVTIHPVDGATGVPLNALILISINKTVGTPVIRLFANDQPEPIQISGGGVSAVRGLQPETNYRVEVDSVQDLLGNSSAPVSATFRTGSARDNTQFRFVDSSPAQSDVGVDPNRTVEMRFNKPLLPGSANRNLFVNSSPSFPGTTQVASSGSTLLISRTPFWPPGSLISINLSRGQFGGNTMDWTGTPLIFDVGLSFRTAGVSDTTPPQFLSANPPSGTSIPADLVSFRLEFSEPVRVANGSTVRVYSGSQETTSYGILFENDLKTAIISLNSPPQANSKLTIIGSGIADAGGNELAPFVLEYPVTELPPSGPVSLEQTEPRQYTQDAVATTNVGIRFDRVMDSASVLAAFKVTENGQLMGGSVDVLENGRAYRFRPGRAFQAGATVGVFVLNSVRDPQGWTIREMFRSFFTVAGTRPANDAFEVGRLGFLGTMAENGVLEVELTADADPSSISGDTVWVRSGKELIAGRVSLRDGRVVAWEPAQKITPGERYVLTIGSGVRSAGGLHLHGLDFPFTVTPWVEDARVLSAERVQWDGRAAWRVRLSSAPVPGSLQVLNLEDEQGRAITGRQLHSPDGKEWILFADAPGVRTARVRIPGRWGAVHNLIK